jgi:hypothetical protein
MMPASLRANATTAVAFPRLEEEFGGGRLVALVADSFLASVPFYALYDARGGDYLIDKGADLFFLPSLAHIRDAPLRRKPHLSRAGLLVAPELDLLNARRRGRGPGLRPRARSGGLGGESEEVEAVRRFGEVRVLTGEEASLRNVVEAMPEAGFAHFFSHGVTNFESPEDAAIILAGGEQLRGAFLRQCRGELLWMVVLGSCYGASYRESYTGETGTSLALDFVRHGVPLVIGSLWFVDTYATEMIMSSLYRQLGQELVHSDEDGLNIAGVFRRALLETRRDFPHVYYWGLFYPLGDFCPRVLQPQATVKFELDGPNQASAVTGEVTARPTGGGHDGFLRPAGATEGATAMQKSDVDTLFERAAELLRTFTYEDFMGMGKDGVPTARRLKFLDLMRQMLQIDPDHHAALNNLAVLTASLPEALQAAEHLVQIDRSYNSYILLGRTLLSAGDSERAGAVLEEALALGSDFYLWIALAQAKANTGRFQEALGCVENALREAQQESDVKTAIELRDKLLRDLNEIHGGSL